MRGSEHPHEVGPLDYSPMGYEPLSFVRWQIILSNYEFVDYPRMGPQSNSLQRIHTKCSEQRHNEWPETDKLGQSTRSLFQENWEWHWNQFKKSPFSAHEPNKGNGTNEIQLRVQRSRVNAHKQMNKWLRDISCECLCSRLHLKFKLYIGIIVG